MTAVSSSMLSQPLLDRCRERAPGYDRDNTFCLEDFNELKAAGYLKMTIPKEFGGLGMGELERLFRDCRAGRFHPANPLLTHEIVDKISLGISPDELPRWG
jgi:alkylation response protein AidB-like acyl-CoA dehydrogenase